LTTTTRRRRTTAPAETPLNPDTVHLMPRYLAGYESDGNGGLERRSTGDEIWGATSADGLWTYTRADGVAGTPWEVVYVPTGQVVTFGALPKARRWTAHDGGEFALANLRHGAQLVIDRRGDAGTILGFNPGTPESQKAEARRREAERCAERLAAALRCRAILDGLMLAGDPDARCTGEACGGYLTASLAGNAAAWVHADACRECAHQPIEKRRECPELGRHVPCGDADPVLCDHMGCTLPAAAPEVVGDCPRGRDACCGCCEHDE
jgi:hypothetical protein